jgi:subtilisin family serine protease
MVLCACEAACAQHVIAIVVEQELSQRPAWEPDAFGGYASNHVIVRVKPGVAPGTLADGRATLIRSVDGRRVARKSSQELAQSLAAHDTLDIRPALNVKPANAPLAAQLGLDRYYRINVPPGSDTPALVADLARFDQLIELAELDGIGGPSSITPNDPSFAMQYWLDNTGQTVQGIAGTVDADIDMPDAWDIATGNDAIVIALLDAGIDQHAELAGRLVPGADVTVDPPDSDTSNVCMSHGTFVSGIAAANANNSIGIAGIDWSAKIMPVKILTGCTGPESYVANGIVYAVDVNADLINMSLQYFTGTQLLHDAVLYAHEQGVPMVAATGNQGNASVAFPARWNEVIAVGATNNTDARWTGSNYGPEIDVMAAGVSLWSLDGVSGYKFWTGTSFSVPQVSGVISLMLAVDPSLDAQAIQDILQQTADDLQAPGFDNFTGWGRINAHQALLAAAAVPLVGDIDGDEIVGPADLAQLLAQWGACPVKGDCAADISPQPGGDGSVGPADLAQLLANWG